MEKGGAWNDILRVRLTELETRRKQIDAELATAVVAAPVTLHPNAAGLYAARVGELETALNDPDLIVEATRTIRSLVQQIVLTPDEVSANGLAVDLHGDLALILSLASGGIGRKGPPASSLAHNEKLPKAMASAMAMGSQLTVVAGTRNQRWLRLHGSPNSPVKGAYSAQFRSLSEGRVPKIAA